MEYEKKFSSSPKYITDQRKLIKNRIRTVEYGNFDEYNDEEYKLQLIQLEENLPLVKDFMKDWDKERVIRRHGTQKWQDIKDEISTQESRRAKKQRQRSRLLS